MALKFIALSGTTSVTHNLYVYETEKEMMVVDCGVGFPDLEVRGVDLVIPDFSYVVKNKNKLVGVLISHGHEDHLGALPYLLRSVKTPIWCTKLASELLKEKFKDRKMPTPIFNVFDEKQANFKIGSFDVHSFGVTHSIPETQGFAIDTPQGRIFHVPEHKVDPNPVVGIGFDEARIKPLAKDVLLLASDCLNSNKEGFTQEETHIETNLENIMRKANQAIFFSAISSNIGRFKQVIDIATRLNRKIVYLGYSIRKKCEIARDLGYLNYANNLIIEPRTAKKMNPSQLLYLVGGCFGQQGSSLHRLSKNEHKYAGVQKGDMVIISQNPAPPYTKEAQDKIVDDFFDLGADVHYYALKEDIYVSGHGCQKDITNLFELVNPKYFIPVGGTVRFMKGYTKLARQFGADPKNIFELKPGDTVIFNEQGAVRGDSIPVKKVYVDGTGIGDVGRIVLEAREALAGSGFVTVVIKVKNNKVIDEPELVTRGFVFEKAEEKMMKDAVKKLSNKLRNLGAADNKVFEDTAQEFLSAYFYSKIQRSPMIVPVVV